MKRFLKALATFSLVEAIGRQPAMAAGMMLIGLGGAVVMGNLITPTITPQASSIFGTTQGWGVSNSVLLPNGGTAGPFAFPSSNTGGFVIYAEATIDQNPGAKEFALGDNSQGLSLAGAFQLSRIWNGDGSRLWWLGTSNTGGASVTGGTGYADGYYPFTATGGGCAREPTGVWSQSVTGGTGPNAAIVDHGFMCSTAPTINTASIPTDGAQVPTGLAASPTPLAATSCAVVSVGGVNQAQVTAHVTVAHGVTPGLTYTMQGFNGGSAPGFTGYNGTYTALLGTSGTTLVGTTGATNCPSTPLDTSGHEGTALSGTGGTITLPGAAADETGVSTHSGQHVCLAFGELGSDGAFPGAQFLTAVDDQGNALPGSPALVPWLNQGTANFTGYITTGSGVTLNVTAMNPYTISNAVYSGGQVTFTTTTNPGFVAGSEFTVSGVSPSGYNQTYVAVAGTGTTTIVGNPLSGPLGTPQALSNPGTYSSGGSLVSVIMPFMAVLPAASGSIIFPFGSGGSTGTGGVGTYDLSTAQGTPVGSIGSPVTIFTYTSYYYTAASSGNPAGGTVTANPQSALGDFVTLIGAQNSSPTIIMGGWGGALGNVSMLYGSAPQPSTSDMASLCKKTTDIHSYATAHSLTVHSLYGLNDPGMWGDSSTAQFTGSVSGTALTVASTQYGSLPTVTGGSPSITVAGSGITGCPLSCPTIASGSGSSYTLSASGGTVASEAMTAGAFKPAKPIATNSINGYINSPSGVPTLHVTSLGTGGAFAQFTGTLVTSIEGTIDNGSGTGTPAGDTLTLISPPDAFSSSPVIGVGTVVTGAGIAPGTTVTALGTGRGFAGTYTVNGSPQSVSLEFMLGGGVLPGFPQYLDATGVTGTLAVGMVVTDGGAHITGAPLLINSNVLSGSFWPINGNYSGAIASETMYATGTTIIPGQYLAQSTITTPTKILGYGSAPTACATTGALVCGTYILSACPNAACAVGTSGSPVAMTTTSISDGGAIAPGPALTIKDLGPGVIFPVNTATGNGTISISGTYDTPTLGGTPTAIQAQISNTAGGPPIPGCSACAWTNVASPTLAGGNWSGQVVNIPAAAGPLYVSVRAANGTAYATMTDFVKVGFILDLEGNGISGGLVSGQAGTALNYYTGLWGVNSFASGQAEYTTGPPLLPNLGYSITGSASPNYAPSGTKLVAGDRFGVSGSATPFLSEGIGALEQSMTTALGWPVALSDWSRDGTGIEASILGNIQQNQTVALADGTKTAWCSSAKFCANASVSGTLFFNAAALTGATMNGATISNVGVLSFPATPSPAPSPTGNGLWQGALEPGMVLSDTTGHVPGGLTLSYCLTGCTSAAYPASGGGLSAQTWQTSSASMTAISTPQTIQASLPAGAVPGGVESPVSGYSLQQAQGVPLVPGGQAFSYQMMQAGTFKISVNGTVVCQDTQTFQYNTPGGNCTGAGISSAFVNYQTGDYAVTFSSAPAANAVITATWTNIISPEAVLQNSTPLLASQARPTGIDFMGDGTDHSGTLSSLFAKTPGGVNGHIMSGCATNGDILTNGQIGYEFLSPGYSKFVSYLYNTRFPATIPNVSAATPFISANQMRTEGSLFAFPGQSGDQLNCNAWSVDVVNQSLFTGTIASSVLTLSGAATGPMWEGEVIAGSGIKLGVYIQSLATGSWGASGSTYLLNGSPANVSSPTAMHNAAYYIGSAPTIYAGNIPDQTTQQLAGLESTTLESPHLGPGFAGGRRIGARWAAEIWEFITNSLTFAGPTVDRVVAHTAGCDTSALASPCFDTGVGSTYNAVALSTTWSPSGNVVTIPGGIAAHARPFVVGMNTFCSSCNSGLFITSVSAPPTQSTVAGQGQVGNTFTITVANASGQPLGGSGSGLFAGGCNAGGSGANCIDIGFKLNSPGATALDTCGANNLNGTAPNYNVPSGICSGKGIGEMIRDFRIGTAQCMLCFAAGSPYMDGADVYNNMTFNQNAAFTCNLVAATVVQCVKGPTYTNGVPTAIGNWSSGSTYIAYGETGLDDGGRIAQAIGYAGGQSFPITNGGSGYTNTTAGHPHTVTATGCTLASGSFPGSFPGVAPTFDEWVSGGVIVDVYPSGSTTNAAGQGVGPGCVIPLPPGGTGGVIPAPVVGPTEGVGGIGTYNTDSNNTGVLLYDNTGEVGKPLNQFFTNSQGGYFEPGLPVTPFGGFMGMQVSG